MARAHAHTHTALTRTVCVDSTWILSYECAGTLRFSFDLVLVSCIRINDSKLNLSVMCQ